MVLEVTASVLIGCVLPLFGHVTLYSYDIRRTAACPQQRKQYGGRAAAGLRRGKYGDIHKQTTVCCIYNELLVTCGSAQVCIALHSYAYTCSRYLHAGKPSCRNSVHSGNCSSCLRYRVRWHIANRSKPKAEDRHHAENPLPVCLVHR